MNIGFLTVFEGSVKAGPTNQNLLFSSHSVSAHCYAEGKASLIGEEAAVMSSFLGSVFFFLLYLPGCLTSEEALPSDRSKLEEALEQWGTFFLGGGEL